MHTFRVDLSWSGSTSTRDFAHEGVLEAPDHAPVPTGSAAAFGGLPTHWNPEELFGAAISTCQLQTFLAIAAKVGVDVLSYDDQATVVLDTVDKVTRVTEVVLRPRITVAPGTDMAKAVKYFEKSHGYCFIANSSTARVVLEPEFVVAG